jgi:hypothetical protein
MGYGQKVSSSGLVELSCVADQASIANAVLEACNFAQDQSAILRWQSCIVTWVEWILGNFANSDGSVGVGIYGGEWNPIPS